MSKTTHYIEVTQGITGPVIDRFTIELDDDLDATEQHRIFNEEARRRLEQKNDHYNESNRKSTETKTSTTRR